MSEFRQAISNNYSNQCEIVNYVGLFMMVQSRTEYFTVKGNRDSEKEVSIEVLGLCDWYGSTAEQALNYINENVEFTVTVSLHGKVLSTQIVKAGGSFYLPRGSQNYTIMVVTDMKNYEYNKLECNNAGRHGMFRLVY